MAAFSACVRLGVIAAAILMFDGVWVTTTTVCPPAWAAWGNSCYILLRDRMEWDQGSRACDRPGTRMLVPDSQEEQDFIWPEMIRQFEKFGINETRDQQVWIDCQDDFNSQSRLKCSGQDGYHSYGTWVGGEPSDMADECVRMVASNGGKWADAGCLANFFVACEMRASRGLSFCRPSTACGHCVHTCLLHHDIATLPATGDVGCARACWAEPRCHSFNLRRSDQGPDVCQLKDASSRQADVNDFERVKNCYFYDL